MKKLALIYLIALLSLSLISAINLDVSERAISNVVITELDEPAIFELTIRNLEDTDSFEIYSVVGLEITPEDTFTINSGEKKVVEIVVNLRDPLKSQTGLRSFEYKIKNSKNEIQKEQLTINLIDLEDAFLISTENINPNSETVSISIKSRATFNLDNIELKADSAFFNYATMLSFKPLEIKTLTIPIDGEKLKTLIAGNYLMNFEIRVEGKTATKEILIKFLEQEGIDSIDVKEGTFIQRNEIYRKNVGNLNKDITVSISKNIISYIFTTLNVEPSQTAFQGFVVKYTWEKELIPNEELKVIAKTNWFYPIFIVLLIILIIYLIKQSVETDLLLRKKVSFVKTKGGQFALKITLKLRAKKYIERINLIDKLPALVNLYNKFGVITPDKIDLNNKRLEWNIETLNKDEERIFTYIIYSKIGVVGRFELPSAKATYEKEGKIKYAESNRSFYINEPGG